MNTLTSILIACLFVSIISFIGAVLLSWKKLLSGVFFTYMVSFAAGVMLTTAFIDLFPEALEGNVELNSIFTSAFLAVLLFFFLERFVLWFHHHDDSHDAKPSIPLILIGDSVHNFIDGVAIAATFLTNPSLGYATTLAIAAHEIPQEIADFTILVSGGLKAKTALFYNFLSGLTALLGAIAGFYFLDRLQGALQIALAFTAGMFIYISCSDLIPDLHTQFKKEKSWRQTMPFIIGIVVTWSLVRFMTE